MQDESMDDFLRKGSDRPSIPVGQSRVRGELTPEVQARMDHCMSCGRKETPDGKIIKFRYRCNYYHFCKNCLKKRISDFHKVVYNAMIETPVNFMILGPDEASVVLMGVNKSAYLKLPMSNGKCATFVDASKVSGGVPVDYELMKSLDWNEIANTPTGSRPSGSLGKRITPPPSDETVSLQLHAFVTNDLTQEEQDAAVDLAVASSAESIKKSIIDKGNESNRAVLQQEALDTLATQVDKAYRAMGAKNIIEMKLRQTVDLASMSWGLVQTNWQEADKVFKDLRDKRLDRLEKAKQQA